MINKLINAALVKIYFKNIEILPIPKVWTIIRVCAKHRWLNMARQSGLLVIFARKVVHIIITFYFDLSLVMSVLQAMLDFTAVEACIVVYQFIQSEGEISWRGSIIQQWCPAFIQLTHLYPLTTATKISVSLSDERKLHLTRGWVSTACRPKDGVRERLTRQGKVKEPPKMADTGGYREWSLVRMWSHLRRRQEWLRY